MGTSKTLTRCKRCVMPDTRPGSIFTDGVCQACINYEKRSQVNWNKRYQDLVELCNDYKGCGEYDCATAVSGGKDSYFIVHTLKNLNLNPLLITIADPFTKSEAGKHNLSNLIKVFGCDHIMFTTDIMCITRKDFEEIGHPLKYLEAIIYTKSIEITQKLNIPLIFFGENPAYDYGTTDKESPTKNGATYLGHYIYWESTRNLKIAKSYGFRDLTGEWGREGCTDNFEQIDSYGYMIHLWLKYPKFGFQRVSDIESRHIREGLQTREQAMKLVRDHDHKLDPKALADFCTTLGYTEKEFKEIVNGSEWNRYLPREGW